MAAAMTFIHISFCPIEAPFFSQHSFSWDAPLSSKNKLCVVEGGFPFFIIELLHPLRTLDVGPTRWPVKRMMEGWKVGKGTSKKMYLSSILKKMFSRMHFQQGSRA